MIVSLSIAFFAGLISFVSPCVLPLIPGYVSFICGTTLNELDLKSLLLEVFYYITLKFYQLFLD
jgi:cytochrome c-type biogenesis protein